MDRKRFYKRWVRAAVELKGDPTSLTLKLRYNGIEYVVYLSGREVYASKHVRYPGWGWTWIGERDWKNWEPEDKKLMGELAYQKVLEVATKYANLEDPLEKPTGRVGEVSWSREERYRAYSWSV